MNRDFHRFPFGVFIRTWSFNNVITSLIHSKNIFVYEKKNNNKRREFTEFNMGPDAWSHRK